MFAANRMIVTAIFTAMSVTMAGTAWADTNAATATVTINATVKGATCTPAWTSPIAPWNLQQASSSSMKQAGDVGANRRFDLRLTGCDAGVAKVMVQAAGTADTINSNDFGNTSTDKAAATGVAVELSSGDGANTLFKPDGSVQAEYQVDPTSHSADMTFLAKLVRTAANGAAIGLGDFSTPVTLYMTYE
ncbi:fimbrial protein [Xanthomonas sontii]|uniref:fimbrial protein n=1 Tax=Xanthomonas sontii TaxID=2650745 RepID=UPI003F828005